MRMSKRIELGVEFYEHNGLNNSFDAPIVTKKAPIKAQSSLLTKNRSVDFGRVKHFYQNQALSPKDDDIFTGPREIRHSIQIGKDEIKTKEQLENLKRIFDRNNADGGKKNSAFIRRRKTTDKDSRKQTDPLETEGGVNNSKVQNSLYLMTNTSQDSEQKNIFDEFDDNDNFLSYRKEGDFMIRGSAVSGPVSKSNSQTNSNVDNAIDIKPHNDVKAYDDKSDLSGLNSEEDDKLGSINAPVIPRGKIFSFIDTTNKEEKNSPKKGYGRLITFQPKLEDVDLRQSLEPLKVVNNGLQIPATKNAIVNLESMKENDFEIVHKKKNSIRFKIDSDDEKGEGEKPEFDSFGYKLDLSQFRAKERNKSQHKVDASNFLNKTYEVENTMENMNNFTNYYFDNDVEEIVPPIDLSKIKGRNNNNTNNSAISEFSNKKTPNNNGRLNTISNFKSITPKKQPNTARDIINTTSATNKASTKSTYRQIHVDTNATMDEYTLTSPTKKNTCATPKTNSYLKTEGDSSYTSKFKARKGINTSDNNVKVNHGYVNMNFKKKAITSSGLNKSANNAKANNLSNLDITADIDNVHYKKKPDTKARYVLLQKQQKYNKILDVRKDSKLLDKSEIINGVIADSQTIDQLINSVRTAYKSKPKYGKHSNNDCNTSNISNNNNTSHISNYKAPLHNRSKSDNNVTKAVPSYAKPKQQVQNNDQLMQMLEEIRARSQAIEEHFKDKENQMTQLIEELKLKLDSSEQTEGKLKEEVGNMKYKLAFFIQDYKNKSIYIILNLENSYFKKDSNLSLETPLARSFMDEINSLDEKMSFKADEFQYEPHFCRTSKVDEYKSYLELLKDFNLDPNLFYDDQALRNNFENDLCECVYDKNLEHDECEEGKWNPQKFLSGNTKMKNFVNILSNRLQHEVRARLKLEEKTLNIFYNDLKNLDNMVIFS
jgi:hypothetical protein